MPENILLAQAQIEMFSPTGRLIYRAHPTGQFHKIETACLPSGLYMVRLWDEKLWRMTKVVVR
ncbi:MAG: T9SS type A sorting domain-containing protein [Bacteroidales bacterium]